MIRIHLRDQNPSQSGFVKQPARAAVHVVAYGRGALHHLDVLTVDTRSNRRDDRAAS